DLWTEKGYVFTSPTGEPLNPNTDYHKWKELLKADARHTAATVLLILGVSDAVVDSIMGWEPGKSARMRRRYQHLTSRVLKDTAAKVGGLLWGTDETAGSAAPEAGQSPVPAELVIHVAPLGEWRVPFLHREHADEVVARWNEDWPDHIAEAEEWDRWRWEQQGPGGASAIRERVPERAVVFHARALFLPGGERAATRVPEQWSVPAWEFETDRYTERASAWRTARRPGTAQEVEAQVRGTDEVAVEAAFVEACAQAVDRAQNPGKHGDTDEW
ncbi:site-specific integrase, partial [Streptomyces rubiginosohelvolus]